MSPPDAGAPPPREMTKPGLQYAALPFRLGEGGAEILLVTSRETGRWVIPKGWPMKGKKPNAAAAREAFEEAGVVGKVGRKALGAYRYVKVLKNGAPLLCTVEVYPLLVAQQRKRWPEQQQRTGHWFAVQDAAEAVREPELQALIARFGPMAAQLAEQIARGGRGGKGAKRAQALQGQ